MKSKDFPCVVMTYKDAIMRYKLSRYTLKKIAKDANAEIYFGRAVRLNIEKMDDAVLKKGDD